MYHSSGTYRRSKEWNSRWNWRRSSSPTFNAEATSLCNGGAVSSTSSAIFAASCVDWSNIRADDNATVSRKPPAGLCGGSTMATSFGPKSTKLVSLGDARTTGRHRCLQSSSSSPSLSLRLELWGSSQREHASRRHRGRCVGELTSMTRSHRSCRQRGRNGGAYGRERGRWHRFIDHVRLNVRNLCSVKAITFCRGKRTTSATLTLTTHADDGAHAFVENY